MSKKANPQAVGDHDLHEIMALFDGPFSIDWIVELAECKPSHVLQALEAAVAAGWIKTSGPGDYEFTDARRKKQIRSQIAPPVRDRWHHKMARQFLKEFNQNNLDPARLAWILLKVPNGEKGCRGLLLAGDAFVKNYQSDKALACYQKLHGDLLSLRGGWVDTLFIDMAIKYSKVSTARQNTTEVLSILEDALQRAVRRKDNAARALLLMHVAKNEWLLNRYDHAFKTFRKGWHLANRCADPHLMRSAISFRTFFSFWQGRFKEVIDHYETALADVEKHPRSGFPLLVTITVGQCYTYVGQITQGLGMLDTIRESCLAAGDRHNAAFATASINTALLSVQSIDETLGYVQPAYAEIQKSGNQYMDLLSKGLLAYLFYVKGDITRSVSFLKKFVKACREVSVDTLHHRPYLLELCWAMEQGRYPRVLNLFLEKEIKPLMTGQNVYLKGLAYRYKALLGIQNGASAREIEDALQTSLKWLEVSGHEFEIIQTRLEILRRSLISGRPQDFEEEIREISGILSQYHDEMIPSDLRALIMGAPTTPHFLAEIKKLARQIMSISDPRDLVQKILSDVNRFMGAERGAIFLVEGNATPPRLSLRASKNLTHEEVAQPDFEPSLRLIRQAAMQGSQGQGVIREEHAPTRRDPQKSADSIRSRICVPMILKEKVIGVLYHDNRLLNSALGDADFELLSFLGTQAALALDNVLAHEEIARLKRTLQEERRTEGRLQVEDRPDGGFVGKSEGLQQVLRLVDQVAPTDANVLILGETGVGKELVANAIHQRSTRSGKPFIKANCSALTETLINSELFGHERGAFTGADSRRIGRFELADGGTILLDEIGDLPLEVQVNLLRVLQDNEFERVGGNQTIRSDFRLLAATNHDLEHLVRGKRFRADLFFRLNVFPIRIPPLRARKEDIPLLVEHFIRRDSARMGKRITTVPPREMNRLIQYDWPGNVRELRNVVERGVILSTSTRFKVPDLDKRAPSEGADWRPQTLRDNERSHILWALEEKGWKVRGPGGVAEFLDIHPSTLAARMKKLSIKRPPKSATAKS